MSGGSVSYPNELQATMRASNQMSVSVGMQITDSVAVPLNGLVHVWLHLPDGVMGAHVQARLATADMYLGLSFGTIACQLVEPSAKNATELIVAVETPVDASILSVDAAGLADGAVVEPGSYTSAAADTRGVIIDPTGNWDEFAFTAVTENEDGTVALTVPDTALDYAHAGGLNSGNAAHVYLSTVATVVDGVLTNVGYLLDDVNAKDFAFIANPRQRYVSVRILIDDDGLIIGEGGADDYLLVNFVVA